MKYEVLAVALLILLLVNVDFKTVMILNVSRLVFSPTPPNFQEMPR
jgi:hypothetical protein